MEATLLYNELLLRRAAFAFWRRTVGWGMPAATAALAACLVYLFSVGTRSWVIGLLGAVLAMGGVMMVAVYLVPYQQAMAKLRAMGEPRAIFRAEDATFTISSGLGSVTLPWSAIIEVWQSSGFWLLLYSQSQFSTLPTESLPPEMQAFILRRVESAGGKIH